VGLAVLFAASACTSGSGSAADASSASAASTPVSVPSSSTDTGASAGGVTSTLGAPQPAPAGGCANGDTLAVIGGTSACLAVGQTCRQPNASEYPAYGYLCVDQGSGFVLVRK
jgi:hypothetical protein